MGSQSLILTERERAYSCVQLGRERKDVLRAEGEDPSM